MQRNRQGREHGQGIYKYEVLYKYYKYNSRPILFFYFRNIYIYTHVLISHMQCMICVIHT